MAEKLKLERRERVDRLAVKLTRENERTRQAMHESGGTPPPKLSHAEARKRAEVVARKFHSRED